MHLNIYFSPFTTSLINVFLDNSLTNILKSSFNIYLYFFGNEKLWDAMTFQLLCLC